MASYAQISAEILRIVSDESYADSLLSMVNQSVREICGGVMILWPEGDQTLSSPMPDLFTIDTVSTSTSAAYVSLPDDYDRNVVFVAVSDGYEPTYESAFSDFVRSFPLLNMSGGVSSVAVKGSNLYYQGIPTTSETLTVHYYRAPTDMAQDSDIPEGIPSRFHLSLIVYDVCLKIFKEIYEEDSDQHDVIRSYENKRMNELINLESLIGEDQGSVIFKSE